MSEHEAHLIEKIASHEAELVEIYADIYYVLKGRVPAELPDSLVSEFPHFAPPEIIEPPKAAAILKAMMGSSSGDKFNFGNCFSIPMPTGQSLSSFVGDQLRGLGIGYRDFWPYLRTRGWLSE